MHSHRIHRATALAAGVLAVLLAGGVASGAFAARPPAQTDPSASPSSSTPDPSTTPSTNPSAAPSAEPSASPTTSPPTSPSPDPKYDMSITGGRAEGEVGDTVLVPVKVHTAGVERYKLSVPVRWGGAEYVGRCEDAGPPNLCDISFDTDGAVDTRLLEFKIVIAGTTPVPVRVHGRDVADPNEANNETRITITTGTPGRPHDVAATANDVTGKVGDIVTVTLTVETSQVSRYHVYVDIRSDNAEYVGRCDHRNDIGNGYCHFYQYPKTAIDKVALKFKITKVGKGTPHVSANATDVPDPDSTNNTAHFTITGLPADSTGSGGNDGDLPLTGSPTATVTAAGAGLLTTGVLLYFAARRRRTTPQD